VGDDDDAYGFVTLADQFGWGVFFSSFFSSSWSWAGAGECVDDLEKLDMIYAETVSTLLLAYPGT
jgi:hypothetical protein